MRPEVRFQQAAEVRLKGRGGRSGRGTAECGRERGCDGEDDSLVGGSGGGGRAGDDGEVMRRRGLVGHAHHDNLLCPLPYTASALGFPRRSCYLDDRPSNNQYAHRPLTQLTDVRPRNRNLRHPGRSHAAQAPAIHEFERQLLPHRRDEADVPRGRARRRRRPRTVRSRIMIALRALGAVCGANRCSADVIVIVGAALRGGQGGRRGGGGGGCGGDGSRQLAFKKEDVSGDVREDGRGRELRGERGGDFSVEGRVVAEGGCVVHPVAMCSPADVSRFAQRSHGVGRLHVDTVQELQYERDRSATETDILRYTSAN